jgi:hypothetical protein
VKRDIHKETINIIIGTLIDCDLRTLTKVYALTSKLRDVLSKSIVETAIYSVIPDRLVNTHTHACISHAAQIFWQEYTNQTAMQYKPTGE